MTGAEIIIKMLETHGIETIAGIPGGANLPMYDALGKSNIKHILVRHEQSAGFIAQGMARTTGKPAVCFATSGPGATNLITALADAKLDSIPIIAFTGQVPLGLIGTDAFQEIDTYGMTLSITKHNFLAKSAQELLEIIPKAFEIASSGRPGPVLIDVPKDIQKEMIEFDAWPDAGKKQAMEPACSESIKKAADMINRSRRPILYYGGGIIQSDATEEARTLSNDFSIPAVHTLMGIGCLEANDPLNMGMLGMHGAKHTNYILDEADLLIAIGARFDDRATGKVEEFCKHASIIHIDIDAAEIGKIKSGNCSIIGDAKEAMKQLIPMIKDNDRSAWLHEIEQIKTEHPPYIPDTKNLFDPTQLIAAVAEFADDDAIITTDVGQHQMWAAQHYPINKPRHFLTSGGLGTMGFGLPAAIGAAMANPDKQIICISGDGSIMMNIQELITLAELDLNISIILLNNSHLGLVRQQQELFYEAEYTASAFSMTPDFAKLAESMGIKGIDLDASSNAHDSLKAAINSKGPAFININIPAMENVYPMVAPGAANTEMIDEPALEKTGS
jgi:acetolactate synthase-1/2/3 large subunit